MKNLLKMSLLALSLSVGMVCVSCGGDEDEPSGNSGSVSNSVLSGKIESFDGSVSQVKAFTYFSDIATPCQNVGEGAILSDGSFSINLATPVSSSLSKIEVDDAFVGTISDPTALVSQDTLGIHAYTGGTMAGVLLKCNNTNIEEEGLEGAAFSVFVYSDKEVKVSGKTSGSISDSEYQVNIEIIENDNFTLKKGWNELVYRVTKLSYTATSFTQEISLTNTISSDLKWRLVSGTLKSAVVYNSPKAYFPKTPLLFKSK